MMTIERACASEKLVATSQYGKRPHSMGNGFAISPIYRAVGTVRVRNVMKALFAAMVAGCANEAPTPRFIAVRVVAHEDSVPGVALFLADGIADEIGDALSRVPGVRTMVRLRSAARPADTGAAEGERVDSNEEPSYTLTLSASYAVTAVGQNDPGAMRIRLVSTLTERAARAAAWTDTVEFPLTRFAAEGRRVVDGVRSALLSTSAQRDTAMVLDSPDATTWLEAFQGWRAVHDGGQDNLEIAFLHFKRALARDTTLARAYLGLALASAEYVDMQTTGAADAALRIAARSVQRARVLDTGLVDAHVLAAVIQIRNASAVDADIVRALAGSPGSPAAAITYAAWSRNAMGALRAATVLDAERAGSHAALALAAIEAGDTATATAASLRAMQLAPANVRWRAVHMMARVMAGNFVDAFADCVVVAGSDAACAALWSDSTAVEERARILRASWARSRGTSEGTNVVPVLEAALWPLRHAARAADAPTSTPANEHSRLDDAANAMTARAMRAAESAPATSYPLMILLSQRNWTTPFRDGLAWKAYVRARVAAP